MTGRRERATGPVRTARRLSDEVCPRERRATRRRSLAVRLSRMLRESSNPSEWAGRCLVCLDQRRAGAGGTRRGASSLFVHRRSRAVTSMCGTAVRQSSSLAFAVGGRRPKGGSSPLWPCACGVVLVRLAGGTEKRHRLACLSVEDRSSSRVTRALVSTKTAGRGERRTLRGQEAFCTNTRFRGWVRAVASDLSSAPG